MRPFRETKEGESLRLSMPLGGLIGEAWLLPHELSAEEIRQDYLVKKGRYRPAPPGEPVALHEMNAHAAAGLWKAPLTPESWPAERKRILAAVEKVLGPFPKTKVPLAPKLISEVDCGSYVRRKVSIAVQPDDRMPAYLLVPKKRRGRVPAIICFYGTTSGAGKDTTVGLSGGKPGTPPEKNRAFAVDTVEAGFVALAPDYLRDGERIGMVGHSYGGHSTIFAAALEPRIKAAVANGPVSAFREHGMHWAVPKGARSSQSLPALRPYLLDPDRPLPLSFHEFTSLAAPRPLLVGQAVGEHRPMEEENYAAVSQVYRALGHRDRVRYHWYAGDHDFPPVARKAAVEWFRRWLDVGR